MAKNIPQLVAELKQQGKLHEIANAVAAQFGTESDRFLGAELLPEKPVKANIFRERAIRYRTIVANDGTRYGPAQKVGNAIIGDALVELIDSNLAIEVTAEEYEAINALLAAGNDVEAATAFLKAVARANMGLLTKNEAHRWEAIVDAQIVLKGDGLDEVLEFEGISNPAGHRVEAAKPWESAEVDPFDDIAERVQVLSDKGYTVSRIVTGRKLVNRMARNPKVKERAQGARVTLEVINDILAEDSLPKLELYDATYQTNTGSKRYLRENVMVFIATTGRTDEIAVAEDKVEVLKDTLGYTAIGLPAGHGTAGRVMHAQSFESLPPRVEIEGWQTSGVVITEPEAIAVLTVPAA